MSQFSRNALFLAVALHLIFAAIYASVTPYREGGVLATQRTDPNNLPKDIGAPDERQHANYIARIADGRGFPTLGDPKENAYENYQAHQPPLFYCLGAAWAKVVGANPVEANSGFRLRLLNALLGGAAVAGIFFLAWWSTKREDVAVGAALFAALLPMNLALSGAISNDPLLYALCAWSLALMMKFSHEGWTLKGALILGTLIGLAGLTKTTAVALFPTLIVAAFLSSTPETGSRFKWPALALGVGLLIPAGWWSRNMQLYGDPLAIGAFNRAFEGSPQASMFIGELGAVTYWTEWVGWWTARSFVGVFGYMDIFLPQTLYSSAVLVFVVLVAAGGMGFSRGLGVADDAPPRRNRFIVWTFLAIIFMLFVRFNTQYFQGQARYLFPALGVIALLVGAGIGRFSPKRPVAAVGVLSIAMIVLNAYALSKLPEEFKLRVRTGVSSQLGTFNAATHVVSSNRRG